MSSNNTNPPAFPHITTRDGDGSFTDQRAPGMTLRDWFAGQALAGADIEDWMNRVVADQSCNSVKAYGFLATYAYGVADALLAQRQKETPDA